MRGEVGKKKIPNLINYRDLNHYKKKIIIIIIIIIIK